ncbi:MAG: alpha/beta fold hydrolase [Rhodospirillales bacterium]|nr:alpha/beta fold hydrolase [Rhodospirillales bacterium]
MSTTRPALLLLPGLLCDAALWQAQIDALSDVAAIHVADLSRDDDVAAMAARAIAAMPARFAVAGLSMGGYVAFAVLRAAGARVSRLMLLDTSARPDTEAQAARRRALMALSRRGRFRGVTPRLLPSLIHRDRLGDAALTGTVMAMAERLGGEMFLRQQAAILGRPDSRPDLGGIAVPTAVLVGAEDVLTPPDCAREMADAIPGAVPHEIPGCGHLAPLECPDIVTAMMRAWLNQGERQ